MRCSIRAVATLLALSVSAWGAAAAPGDARAGGPALLLRPEAARVAVLPVQNLSGEALPLGGFQQWLLDELTLHRIPLLDDMALRAFMRRHRMRDVGGLSREMGRAMQEETGASVVLVSSIDLYDAATPPRFALTARLVTTGDEPRIIWMDSADRTGDEAPGFLGTGRIDNRIAVQRVVIDGVIGSLVGFLRAAGSRVDGPGAAAAHARRRDRPRSFFRAASIVPPRGGRTRVAVLPFSNESTTRRAGEILELHLIRHLVRLDAVDVIEPGIVRQALLRQRLIQIQGLSVPQADLVRQILDVDVALFGEVAEYRETGAGTLAPQAEFSVRAIDTASRQMMWASSSYGRGDDGVFFFEAGKLATAHRLSSNMAEALVETIVPALEGSP